MTSSSERTDPLLVPRTWEQLRRQWDRPESRRELLEGFESGRWSFIPNLLPEQALQLTVEQTLQLLERRLGSRRLEIALSPKSTDPDQPYAQVDPAIRGPVAEEPDGSWLKRANVVGVNVRTIGSLFDVVKYSLTLPRIQDAIHLLPIWEPGVIKSLYGPCSWELNGELFSPELAAAFPHLGLLERQLRAVVNLLHATGRAVGMDVIPHTDRYSQTALAFPEHFEWLRREGLRIVDHREELHEQVQEEIVAFLAEHGPACPGTGDEGPLPTRRAELFGEGIDEERRLRLLFGLPEEPTSREERRIALVVHLRRGGYEPVPATMAPPYRGLAVDPRPEAERIDEHGMAWRDYVITDPQPMSRVFGPLARYKLYGRKDDNERWEIDFDRPREAVWRYVCEKYADVQRRYGLDFMRGDMSHVQMRPSGVPDEIDEHYDLLRAVKLRIQRSGARHFGYFAESFLAPRDTMGYGDEVDHLEASEAEITLGNLQSMAVDTPQYSQELRRYWDLGATRRCAPCLCVMTADKDDPRFDAFYLSGGPLRLFLALFIGDLPSYMGLGFETRDVHHVRAPNEHYTKLYVFQERQGPNVTRGPYVWGRNGALFHTLTRIRLLADRIGPEVCGRPTRWLACPEGRVLCWTQAGAHPAYLFVANTDTGQASLDICVSLVDVPTSTLTLELSTADQVRNRDREHAAPFNGEHFELSALGPGECRAYKVGATTRR